LGFEVAVVFFLAFTEGALGYAVCGGGRRWWWWWWRWMCVGRRREREREVRGVGKMERWRRKAGQKR
jgi:hypothetical protein